MKKIALILTPVIMQASLTSYAHGLEKHGGERVKLSALGSVRLGQFDTGAAEIISFDAASKLVYATNSQKQRIDVVSIARPANPVLKFSINTKPYGVINSVAYKNGLVAAALQAANPQDNGLLVLFNDKGELVATLTVGAKPDMVVFTPDGKRILVANEGEPNDAYTIDPQGSISVIALPDDLNTLAQENVSTADFQSFDSKTLDPNVRIFGKNAKPSQDLEPEYISVSANSKTAWVSLQENNAIAELDINNANVVSIIGLGTQSHNNAKTAIDASDDDGGINIKAWPIEGLYQPDAIASYQVNGKNYIVTANEGDARNYPGFSEQRKVQQLDLEPSLTDNHPQLQSKENLGGLKVSIVGADSDNNNKIDRLVTFGTRSFSIWDADLQRVYDSGSQFARIVARDYPKLFNFRDSRSNDKGAEPEALTLGKVGDATFAFIGLERTGGIMTYNISDPESAFFVDYFTTISPRLEPDDPNAGDQAPESLVFVSAKDSPTKQALLLSGNELSGTLSVYRIEEASPKHH